MSILEKRSKCGWHFVNMVRKLREADLTALGRHERRVTQGRKCTMPLHMHGLSKQVARVNAWGLRISSLAAVQAGRGKVERVQKEDVGMPVVAKLRIDDTQACMD